MQHYFTDWFDQIVIPSYCYPAYQIFISRSTGQKDNGRPIARLFQRAYLLGDFKTLYIRKNYIQQNNIGTMLLEQINGHLTRLRHKRLPDFHMIKITPDRLGCYLTVLDNQHL